LARGERPTASGPRAGYKGTATDLGDHIAIHISPGKHAGLSRLPARKVARQKEVRDISNFIDEVFGGKLSAFRSYRVERGEGEADVRVLMVFVAALLLLPACTSPPDRRRLFRITDPAKLVVDASGEHPRGSAVSDSSRPPIFK